MQQIHAAKDQIGQQVNSNMSTTSSICCRGCERHRSDPLPISHLPNPTPEQACQIAELDADIQRTDDHIKALANRRAALSRKRNALVPAVNLPPEVLITIFGFACYPIHLEYKTPLMAKSFEAPFRPLSTLKQNNWRCITTPSIIATVCSAWRNIAMETTQLWSDTRITFNNDNADAQAAKLRYWISKSGQRPLTVSVAEDPQDDHDYEEDSGIWSTAVLDVLEAYAHRIETLDMFLPEAWQRKPAMARIANRLPLLTRLTLSRGVGLQRIEDFNVFAHAPKLREVKLLDLSITTVRLPWAQLERLDMTGDGSQIQDCLDSLSLCPRLRSYMTTIRMSRYTFNVLTPMTHTTLEVLEVTDDSVKQGRIHEFLEVLTLPMLRSLSLSILAKSPNGIPSLLSFLSRSGRKLETLCLAGQMPLADELWTCLHVLPQLRKLVLNNKHRNAVLTQRTLDMMNPAKYAAGEAGRCLAPNLETFYYSGRMEPTTPHALVEFLADRWHFPSTARTSGHDVEIPPGMGSEARTAREGLPPRVNAPVVRLRSAAFITLARLDSDKRRLQFDDADTAVLQRLRQEGMSVVV